MDNEVQEQMTEEKVQEYLDNNGLIKKWEETGMFQEATTNSEKYLIASVMESMIYRSFEMVQKEGKTSEEMNAFQEKYISLMAQLGIFNGSLLQKVNNA